MSKYLDTAGLTRLWGKIKGMFAPLASPGLTGTPTAPTAAAGTNTTQLATTAFVKTAVDNAAITVDSALSSSSTNPVQNKAINTALGLKANLASPTFTGTPKAPTAAAGTNTTQLATTAFVKTAITNAAVTVDTSMSDASTNPVQNKVAKAYIDSKVSAAYKTMGNLAPSGIVSTLLVAANEGNVYNINAEFTTSSDFVEGAGKTYPAGTNIVVIKQGALYKFDVLSGFVDLSGYVTTTAMNNALRNKTPWANTGFLYLEDQEHSGESEPANPGVGEAWWDGHQNKLYKWDGSQWVESTEGLVSVGGYSYVGDDSVGFPNIYFYNHEDSEWQLLTNAVAFLGDLSRYAFKDYTSVVGMVYLDAAHWKVSSAPVNKSYGDFYYSNAGVMYQWDGSAWQTYTGKGWFIGNENVGMGKNVDYSVPAIYAYDLANAEWINILEKVVTYEDLSHDYDNLSEDIRALSKNNSPVKEVIRPLYVGGALVYSSTYADKWIFNVTTRGQSILYGNAETQSFDTPANPDKLFLYDGELWQVIDSVPTRVGYTESITDSEIDTICV